jgi:hypothetical protein
LLDIALIAETVDNLCEVKWQDNSAILIADMLRGVPERLMNGGRGVAGRLAIADHPWTELEVTSRLLKVSRAGEIEERFRQTIIINN